MSADASRSTFTPVWRAQKRQKYPWIPLIYKKLEFEPCVPLSFSYVCCSCSLRLLNLTCFSTNRSYTTSARVHSLLLQLNPRDFADTMQRVLESHKKKHAQRWRDGDDNGGNEELITLRVRPGKRPGRASRMHAMYSPMTKEEAAQVRSHKRDQCIVTCC